MDTRQFFASAAVVALLYAAPALAQQGAGTPPSLPSPAQNSPLPSKNTQPTPGQAGQIVTPRDKYKVGQNIPVQFIVGNNSKTSVAYDFPSGQQYDVTAAGTDGKAVWTWSKGRTFTQGISRLALAPGAHKAFAVVWNGFDNTGHAVAPGPYTLTARLLSNNGPAITGSLVVNNDPDPNNIGSPTHTPADNGAIRQVDVLPPITATKTLTLTK